MVESLRTTFSYKDVCLSESAPKPLDVDLSSSSQAYSSSSYLHELDFQPVPPSFCQYFCRPSNISSTFRLTFYYLIDSFLVTDSLNI